MVDDAFSSIITLLEFYLPVDLSLTVGRFWALSESLDLRAIKA